MARIIVAMDSPNDPIDSLLYQERVNHSLLRSAFAAEQLLERLAWAVADAEEAERRVLRHQ